jgi:hypothetical protein
MKIEFEIDDKYKDTNLHLFWGMVPIRLFAGDLKQVIGK